jgi:hypothetical protein
VCASHGVVSATVGTEIRPGVHEYRSQDIPCPRCEPAQHARSAARDHRPPLVQVWRYMPGANEMAWQGTTESSDAPLAFLPEIRGAISAGVDRFDLGRWHYGVVVAS